MQAAAKITFRHCHRFHILVILILVVTLRDHTDVVYVIVVLTAGSSCIRSRGGGSSSSGTRIRTGGYRPRLGEDNRLTGGQEGAGVQAGTRRVWNLG